jgi:fused signal recognition particle receptor
MTDTLVEMMSNEKAFSILDRIRETEKPLKVMFLGINGAGKTTTIAKVAKLLQDNDYKVVFAAADTFRAAAIEQMQIHADRLEIRVIKRDYGSDPTSVAYDAVNYAKAHGIDAVLIDTAGRQDTNLSLINEVKKMSRVIEPDLKIYIGESIAGNAIIEQISSFNKEVGIDAVILTKLDCDPKGGTMLSINRATGVPIIYVGIGQGYEDLELFDAREIVERIVK